LKFDILVEDCVLVEVKAVETVHPIHKAQLLSYMKLLDILSACSSTSTS
jgi:GxxExxY protein